MDKTSVSRERRSHSPSGEPRPKREKLENVNFVPEIQPPTSPVQKEPHNRAILPPARESSAKLSVVLKPPANSAVLQTTTTTVPEIVVEQGVAEDTDFRDKELSRWTPKSLQQVPRYIPSTLSDDSIIRTKLMFEAGNPPANSHRGMRLLAGNIGVMAKQVRDLGTEEDVEAVAQRIQLHIQQEELTLTRLDTGCEFFTRIAENETQQQEQLRTSLADVLAEMDDQRLRLEEANKTDLLFAGYIESANIIRKIDSYDELLRIRNKLKEETKKLKDERTRLDRQYQEKLPYLVIANWALKNLRYGEGSSSRLSAFSSDASPFPHFKSTNKHKKSPKKSSKEPKST